MPRMARWLPVLAALALLPLTGAYGKTKPQYEVGRIVRIESAPQGDATLYEIYIQQNSQTYAIRLNRPASRPLSWKLNDPVKFRIRKRDIDLLQPDGKRITIALDTTALRTGALLGLDLPFPVARPTAPAAIPTWTDTTTARCRQVLSGNSQYSGLMNACRFALSPRNLPDFLCKETMQRSIGAGPPPFWQPIDTLSMDVTFLARGTDRYSDFWPYDPRLRGVPGWLSLAQFGREVESIFDPAAHTHFVYRGVQKLPSGSASLFAFEFDAANNLRFPLIVNGIKSYPGLTGLLWTDEVTGQLVRVQAYATELNSRIDLQGWAGAVNYAEAPIAGLGSFLLPAADEVEVCLQNGTCYKNLISFAGCKKFVATVRILPGATLQH